MEPAIIVHGGCGYITKESQKPQKLQQLKTAVVNGIRKMKDGGSSLDAVEIAVTVLEDSPLFNAGVGSVLRIDGSIELDALIMEGKDLRAGSVAAVKGVKNPAKLARMVMEKTDHIQLCGEGASLFSRSMGFDEVSDNELRTSRATERLEKFLAEQNVSRGSDTIGAVAIDSSGCIACCTSTGGILGAMKGRVGDTPQIGSGGYSDNLVGGVSTTGDGECIARVTLARLILFHMEQGLTVEQSLKKSLHYMKEKTGCDIGGAIVISSSGVIGKGFISPEMSWASLKGNELRWGFSHSDDFMETLLDR